MPKKQADKHVHLTVRSNPRILASIYHADDGDMLDAITCELCVLPDNDIPASYRLIRDNRYKCLDVLLRKFQARYFSTTDQLNTLLSLAIDRKSIACVGVILTQCKILYPSQLCHLVDSHRSGEPWFIHEALCCGFNHKDKFANGGTFLHLATQYNVSTYTVRCILDQDPLHLNATDAKGRTPLYYAISCSREYAIIEYLLAAGADPNIYDRVPPIVRAAQLGKDDIVRLLFKYKADLNATVKSEPVSAVSWAAINGKKTLLYWFMEKNARANDPSVMLMVKNSVLMQPDKYLQITVDMLKYGFPTRVSASSPSVFATDFTAAESMRDKCEIMFRAFEHQDLFVPLLYSETVPHKGANVLCLPVDIWRVIYSLVIL